MEFKENILNSYVNLNCINTSFFIHDGTAAGVQHSSTDSRVKSSRIGRLVYVGRYWPRQVSQFFTPPMHYACAHVSWIREMVAGMRVWLEESERGEGIVKLQSFRGDRDKNKSKSWSRCCCATRFPGEKKGERSEGGGLEMANESCADRSETRRVDVMITCAEAHPCVERGPAGCIVYLFIWLNTKKEEGWLNSI